MAEPENTHDTPPDRLSLDPRSDYYDEALLSRGVGVSDVQQLGPQGAPGSRFCFFEDLDGNVWAVQELKRS